MLDQVPLERAAAHYEVHVDASKHLGVGFGALRSEPDLAAGHLLTAFLEDDDDVVRGAASSSDEHHLHRAWREVPSPAVGRPVHGDQVIAAGFRDEAHSFAGPAHAAFHAVSFGSEVDAAHHWRASHFLPEIMIL